MVATLVDTVDSGTTGTYDVTLVNTTGGDITIGSITSDNDVSITSAGSILDANNDATTDITATNAVLTAATGVGSGQANINLETAVDDLDVSVASGDIDIAELDAVTLSDVDTADDRISVG